MVARVRTGLLLCTLLLTAAPFTARADVIDSFLSTVHIRTDGAAEVTEEISYDFGTEQHHGIYRDIPVVYNDETGATQRINLDSLTVTDGKLSPYVFETFMNGNDLRIKIGDPAKLVTGKKMYEISYVAHGVVGFFPTYDELYWNATGDEWPIKIVDAATRVYAPASTTKATCYVGARGSTSTCAVKESISGDGSAY